MTGARFHHPVSVALIAGVDEVGRGPLAGPVVTAAVILDRERPVSGLDDSKALTSRRREQLDIVIRERCVAMSLGRAEVEEIDRLNILGATLLAMKRAVEALDLTPGLVLVDGLHCPELMMPVQAVVRGDQCVAEIKAASIVAKVARDREMRALAHDYPGYGFETHKGYPTRQHRDALARLGVTPVHRRSFAPVRNQLA